MRGEYALKPLAYGVHDWGVQLVEIVKYPLAKYVVKDRSHVIVLINLYLGSRGQLMGPWAVQKDIHTLGTLNKMQQTDSIYICLFYRLCHNQEQSHQNNTKILPQVYHKFQRWYKCQVYHKQVVTWRKSQPQFQPMYLWGQSRSPLA